MHVFDDIMKGFRTVFDDGLKKPLKGVTRESKVAADSLSGLEKSIASINKNTDRPVTQFTTAMGKVGRALSGVGAAAIAFKVFADQGARYNDIARQTIRGTSLLGRSTKETNDAVRELHKSSVAVKMWMGGTAEEAAKFSANLRQEWARTTRDKAVKDPEAVAGYEKSMEEIMKAAGIGPDELARFHSSVVAQANLTMRESKDVLDHITKAAIEFGIAGPDSIQHLIDKLETVHTMEAVERVNFLKEQVEQAAIQKKASMGLGKYVSDIGSRKGADAFKEYAKIASITGKSFDQVTSVMRGNDQPAQIKLQNEYLGKFGNIARYMELQSKVKTKEGLSGGEATEMLTMEMRWKPFADGLNKSVDEMLAGENALVRTPTDAAEKLRGTFENLNKVLETTIERSSGFEAEIQAGKIKADEAAGIDINTEADAMRSINAGLDQKGFGAAAATIGASMAGAFWKFGKAIPGVSGAGGLTARVAGAVPGGLGLGNVMKTGLGGLLGYGLDKATGDAKTIGLDGDSFGGKFYDTFKPWVTQLAGGFATGGLAGGVRGGGIGLAGIGMKIVPEDWDAGAATLEAITSHFKTKEMAEKFNARTNDPTTVIHEEAQETVRKAAEFRKAMAAKAQAESLKAVSEKATGPSVEKATDVKVTPTTIRDALKKNEKSERAAADAQTDVARLVQKFADQPNTIPVLSEIRDLLSHLIMNGGSIA